MPKIDVAIVGAGIGGLCLAHALIDRGANVRIYERDSSATARRQGYRIQLGGEGLQSLRDCVPTHIFARALATAGAPQPQVGIRDPQLQLLSQSPPTITGDSLDSPLAFDRATLRDILLSGLHSRIRYNSRFTGCVEDTESGVIAHFSDGFQTRVDLLVGADGVNSAVRRTIAPGFEVSDAGLRLIYGKVPLSSVDAREVPPWALERIFTVVSAGPGRPHIGMGPVQMRSRPETVPDPSGQPLGLAPVDDYLALMVGFPVSEFPELDVKSADSLSLGEIARTMIDGDEWHPDLRTLTQQWLPETLIPLTISTAPPIRDWPNGPVAVIGDAAHPMSPVLAMGANTAIRDAKTLAEALIHTESTAVAVSEYHRRMVSYAEPLVAASRNIGRSRVGQA